MPSSHASPAATLVATTQAVDLNPGNTRRSTRAWAPPRAAPSTIPPATRIGSCVPDDISRGPRAQHTGHTEPSQLTGGDKQYPAPPQRPGPGVPGAAGRGDDRRRLTWTSLMPRRRTGQGPAVRRCGTFGPDAAFLPRRDRSTGVSGPLAVRWGPAAMFAVPRPGVPWSTTPRRSHDSTRRATRAHPPPRTDSRLGLPQSTALVMGSIIGVGIFSLPYAIASYGPISLVAMALATVGAVALAFMFAVCRGASPLRAAPTATPAPRSATASGSARRGSTGSPRGPATRPSSSAGSSTSRSSSTRVGAPLVRSPSPSSGCGSRRSST